MTTSNLDGLRAAIEGAAQTAWVAAGNTSDTLIFGNMAYDPQGQTLWARVTIRYGMTNLAAQATVGSGALANTAVGVVMVQVFGPPGEGTGSIVRAMDALRDAFNRKVIGGAQLMAASGNDAPDVDPDDPGWATARVTVPFEYDEVI